MSPITRLELGLWIASIVVALAGCAHGAELAPTPAPIEVNEHGYPLDVRYGIYAAPSGDQNNKQFGTLGYSIGPKGWADGYITPILMPAIEAGREPDFVLCGSPGPYWRGWMCWQSPLHCLSPRPDQPCTGPPAWAQEWAGEPLPHLQVIYHSWGEWRRLIPRTIEVGMYGGRLNNPELIAMAEADPAAAIAVCDRVMEFYTQQCGFDFIAIDATAVIGGKHDAGVKEWAWLQAENNPLALWFAAQCRRSDVRVYAEAWPQSGDLGQNTRNRLLGPLSPTGKGAPCMVLWRSKHNTPLYSSKPNLAPAAHHDCMILGTGFAATPDECVDAVSRGVKEIAIDPGVWRRIVHQLPSGD